MIQLENFLATNFTNNIKSDIVNFSDYFIAVINTLVKCIGCDAENNIIKIVEGIFCMKGITYIITYLGIMYYLNIISYMWLMLFYCFTPCFCLTKCELDDNDKIAVYNIYNYLA